jgi:tetratricopeptide (TPR) repeat protein
MADAWNAGQPERVLELAAGASGAVLDDEGVQVLLGLAQQQRGSPAQAAAIFERLTRSRPDVAAYWNNLGVTRRQVGDLAASEAALHRAQALAPNDADVRYNLGLLYIQQQRWAAARDVLLDAVDLAPGFIEARLEAAHACHVCGNIEGEEAMLEGADGWPPQPAEQALVLASILSGLGRLETALKVLSRALLPAGPAADWLRLRIAAQRAALYERNNMLEHAQRELAQLPLDALDAASAEATQLRIDGWQAHAVVALRQRRHADAAALYQRVLDTASDNGIRASAAFGLAAARDRESHHHAAWKALAIAHATQVTIARQATSELSTLDGQPLPMVTRTVDADAYAAWRPLDGPSVLQSPVFVIGFPRSGTTMLEQMLDAHPDFRSMDERGYVYQLIERMKHAGQRYPADLADLTQDDADQLRAVYWQLVGHTLPDLGRRRLIDKNPLNLLCLPLIMRLFPAARIILCIRHPCDVVLSCYMQAFRSPAFMVMCSSLPKLARGYADAFGQCCAHLEVFKPRVLEWRYETVIDAFEDEVARLGRYLEIADATPMAGFAEHARHKRFISTPSYAEVVRPVNRAAVGRWLAYREQFEPVLPILRPWLDRFGYTA